MKALSLPINTIVIITIVLLVFLVVAAFFTSGAAGGMSKTKAYKIWNEGCTQYCENCEAAIEAQCHTNIIEDETCTDKYKTDDFVEACKILGYISVHNTIEPCFAACQCSTNCKRPRNW